MITARDRFPSGTPVEWTEETGRYSALELPDGKRVGVTCIEHVPTAEEIAAKAASDAKAAEVAAEKAALAKLVDDLKTGKLTFGDASKDAAVLALAKVQARTAVSAGLASVATVKEVIAK